MDHDQVTPAPVAPWESPIDDGAPIDHRTTEGEGASRFAWTFDRGVSLIVVAACCAYMFWQTHPNLVLADTTPTGGDMGAHVWGPDFMKRFLLPEFSVTGWTTDWYAGFPAYVFYMVVPSLAIVMIDAGVVDVTSPIGAVASLLVVGAAVWGIWAIRHHESRLVRFLTWIGCGVGAVLVVDVPYNVAFKLIAVSGLVAFPAGVFYLLRGLSLRHPGPELGAIASVPFLMDKGLFHIYGGNMASTMAGEFAFSISITLALFGLGLVANGVRTGRYRARAAMVIALSVLCHVIPGFFFLVTAAVIIVLLRPRRSSWRWAIPTGVSAGMMALWWYLPFYGRSAYLNDMGWEKLGVQLRAQSWPRLQIASALRNAGVDVMTSNPVDAIRFDRNWSQIWRHLLPFAPHHIGEQSFDDPNMLHGRFIFALAALGVILSVIMVVRSGIFLTAIALITAVAFVYMPQHRFWNARVLPFYYLSIYLLAGVAVALLLRAVVLAFTGKWVDPHRWVSVTAVAVASFVVFTVVGMSTRTMPGGSYDEQSNFTWLGITSRSSNPVRGWAKWNFEGLERKPGSNSVTNSDGSVSEVLDTKHSEEYFAMIEMMRRVGETNGCGRAFWEYGERLGSYGTPMSPMLLPYFTDRCIGSMEGLYFEASSTTPFHFLVQSELSEKPSRPQRFDSHLGFAQSPYSGFDLDRGLDHLQMLGVRYYMAFTPTAKAAADAEAAKPEGERRLTFLDESPWADEDGNGEPDGSWKVYEVADVTLVEPLEVEPVVWTDVTDDIYDYVKPAVDWFNDPDAWDVLRATDGPDSWERIRSDETPTRRPLDADDVEVSDVRTTQDTISFRVSRPGTPVLVRASYFPNWKVDGADGPYRVTPNQIVVVPTDTEVRLHYERSGLEWLAYLLSLAGFALFMYFVVRGPGLAVAPETSEFLGDREAVPDPVDGPDVQAPVDGSDVQAPVDGPDVQTPVDGPGVSAPVDGPGGPTVGEQGIPGNRDDGTT